MKTIINDDSGLPKWEVMGEITRIMYKGLVTISDKGPSYQARTIFEGCVFECKRNDKSFTFTVSRI